MVRAVALLLITTATALASQWLDVQPAYNTDLQVGTVRLEGGGKREGLSLYGFVDLSGDTDRRWAFKHPYGEARLMRSLQDVRPDWQAWNLTVEYNGGEGVDDLLRVGLVWNTSLLDGNTTALKLYPVATRDHDAQVSLYSRQALSSKLSAYVVFDYGFGDWVFGEAQIYLECELRYQVTPRFAVFAQTREFTRARGWSFAPSWIVGTKLSF